LKPKHVGWYSGQHVLYCEQTLLTLLHKMGPWKHTVFLVGGLAPRYLFPEASHAGTTDVDLVVSLDLLAETEAYRTLEKNLKEMGFERSVEEGRPVHWRWRKAITDRITVLVELLCDQAATDSGKAVRLPGEKQLSALNIKGANLAAEDFLEVELRGDLLDGGGVAIETVRVVGLAAFLVLKARAYGDRGEQKDAYDLVYCLLQAGPEPAAAKFQALRARASDPTLFDDAIRVLQNDFGTDEKTEGHRKNGPVAYAAFLTDPASSDPNADIRRQREATGVVEAFLSGVRAFRAP
jgi:hypothetical protein